jgi:hypothetical protein
MRIDQDLRRVRALAGEMARIREDVQTLRASSTRKDSGYFDSREHDAIAGVLFRYIGCREGLWEIIHARDDLRLGPIGDEEQAGDFLLTFNAAAHLAYSSAGFVRYALHDPLLQQVLNEEYLPYDIPRGTFDKVFASVTSVENIRRLKAAWQLFREEIDDPRSIVRAEIERRPAYAVMAREIGDMYPPIMEDVEAILKESSLLLPAVRNQLRHSEIGRLAKVLQGQFDSRLYAARGAVCLNVSRLKTPTSRSLAFTREQVESVLSALQPGDIVLTYTAGYMSNLFLPGLFKHGITYVGSPEQRRAAGLVDGQLTRLPESRQRAVRQAVETAVLPAGDAADVIEAVAEGVIFNSLEHLMQTHVNRMLVLRPRLSDAERTAYLVSVFALLGARYDFDFDFTDANYQCCTEVIYRGLNGLGSLSFDLTPRMGRKTLSADDIVNRNLAADGGLFDVVLLAAEDPHAGSPHAAVLHSAEAAAALRSLMNPRR